MVEKRTFDKCVCECVCVCMCVYEREREREREKNSSVELIKGADLLFHLEKELA